MSQFNLQVSQVQSSSSENQQPSSSYNPQNTVSSHESLNECHVTSAAAQSQLAPVIDTNNHPNVFFFRPPNDFYHYYVICKEISYDAVENILNKPLNGNNVSFVENEC